jgi:hypothetical protein
MKKLLTASFAALACFAGAPVYAMTPGECTNQQGRTLAQIQNHLGAGKLISASAATAYSDGIETYTFGNYYTGSCLVMMKRGRAEYVTYTKF